MPTTPPSTEDTALIRETTRGDEEAFVALGGRHRVFVLSAAPRF